jgi:hypothetical protein
MGDPEALVDRRLSSSSPSSVGHPLLRNSTPPPMVLRLLLPSFVFLDPPRLVAVFHLGHRAPFYPPSVRHAGDGSRWISSP